MIHIPLIGFGVVLVLVGLGSLAVVLLRYRQVQRKTETAGFDRERTLAIAVVSGTVIFGGGSAVYIGLWFAGLTPV